MRKLPVILGLMVVLALFLAACAPATEGTQAPGATALPGATEPVTTEPAGTLPVGTEPVGTPVVGTPSGAETQPAGTEPAATEPAATETMAVTETPSAGGTEVLPPTGALDPGRLSVLRTFVVCSQAGNPVGDVYDFVLSLDQMQVAYVIVDTGRFEATDTSSGRLVAIPWKSLEVQPKSDAAQSQDCNGAFVLQVSDDLFTNAPQFDLNMIPAIGAAAEAWDAEILAYWAGGTTGAAGTPAAGAATAMPTAPATPTPGAGLATGTPAAGQATATPSGGTGPTTTQAATPGGRLMGVIRARQLIGVHLVSEDGQEMGVIRDVLVDITTGQIRYVVLELRTATGQSLLIAVPVQILRWDPAALKFGFTVERSKLEAAPAFQGNAIPNTQTSGWDTDILNYWRDLVEGLTGGG